MSSTSDTQSNAASTREASASVPRTNLVPLITPRYQKKQRANRCIEVTDSSEERKSATTALQEHTKELLTVRNGPFRYEQEMHFHPYELYKHGKHQIHSRSIGYSSDGDLVITREAISEPSDVDFTFRRRRAEIDKAVCLNPKARRPMTDAEVGKKLRFHSGTLNKYPGIRAPKNRKTRNRLLNDYFATEYARKIMDKYRERQANGEVKNDVSPILRPAFSDLPPVFDGDFFDLDEDAQTRALEQFGVDMHRPSRNGQQTMRDPDAGETRFQSLNARLRNELLHALNSEFLSRQIDDLERSFSRFILNGNTREPLVYHFRDGYGRLVCHGVAAFYNLVSESQLQPDGTKITVVSWPRKRKEDCNFLYLPKTSLMQILRKGRSNMPGKHSCSAASTPQTTPSRPAEQPEVTPPPFSLDATNGTPVSAHLSANWTPGGSGEHEEGSPTDSEEKRKSLEMYEPPLMDNDNLTATQRKKNRKAMRAKTMQEVAATSNKSMP